MRGERPGRVGALRTVGAVESYVRDLVAVLDDGRLQTLLSEHLVANDELLAHVFFRDLVRWLERDATHDQQRQVSAYVERGLEAGDPDVLNLIAVCFLENLADDSPIWSLLLPGTRLSAAP